MSTTSSFLDKSLLVSEFWGLLSACWFAFSLFYLSCARPSPHSLEAEWTGRASPFLCLSETSHGFLRFRGRATSSRRCEMITFFLALNCRVINYCGDRDKIRRCTVFSSGINQLQHSKRKIRKDLNLMFAEKLIHPTSSFLDTIALHFLVDSLPYIHRCSLKKTIDISRQES